MGRGPLEITSGHRSTAWFQAPNQILPLAYARKLNGYTISRPAKPKYTLRSQCMGGRGKRRMTALGYMGPCFLKKKMVTFVHPPCGCIAAEKENEVLTH